MGIEKMSKIPRMLDINDTRYMNLKQYKNKYKNKRCFIACTGPSLTIEDLESLSGEYVFGMNSIIFIGDKTKWRPDFYGIQDEAVYLKLKEAVQKTDFNNLFFSHDLRKHDLPKGGNLFFLEGYYHWYEFLYRTKYFTRFSTNCYVNIYDGYSITFSLIQLAVYMGFKDIYLIGADCNYMGSKEHFIETGVSSATEAAGDRLIAAYKDYAQYSRKYGFNIYNATRGGKLEVFPRVAIEDILANPINNKNND